MSLRMNLLQKEVDPKLLRVISSNAKGPPLPRKRPAKADSPRKVNRPKNYRRVVHLNSPDLTPFTCHTRLPAKNFVELEPVGAKRLSALALPQSDSRRTPIVSKESKRNKST
jgi:hypothetical protein